MGSFAALWAPTTLVILIVTRPSTFIKGPLKILLLYGIIMIGILQYTLWSYMNDWNRYRIFAEFYYLLVITAIFFYYWSKLDFRRFALLSKWAFIFIIISLITTNIALYFDPNVIRQSAVSGNFTPFQEKLFKLTGAMGYSYVQAVVCLIPILVYHIKNKKKMVFTPKILIVILILIFITEVRAQIFANVLVTAMIIILSFMATKKRRTSFIIVLLIGILFMIIPNSFYSDTFYFLSSFFDPDSEMYYKLTDFARFIKYEGDTSTGLGNRAERYPMLFEALAASPILGDSSYESHINIELGAHIYWMNRLALWGIFGFSFFIFTLFKIFKSISSIFDADFKYYYFLSMAAIFLLGLTKTVGGREPWLMLIVIIPGLYFLPILEQQKKKKPN
jgi:hypothetical protein